MLGEGNGCDVEMSEFCEAFPVSFLIVSTGRQFSYTGVDVLGSGQDYRLVVTASKLLTDFSSGNLLNVIYGYGSIWCAGCIPHS